MPPKSPLTHFLCLPLVTSSSRPQLQASLSRFAAETTQPDENGHSKIPPRALRPVGAIHLTVGVMSLQTPERIQEACKFLRSLNILQMLRAASSEPIHATKSSPLEPPSEKASTPPPISNPPLSSLLSPNQIVPHSIEIALTNLTPMQSSSSTSSLYASPNPLHPILPFAQRLHDAFLNAGFLVPPPTNRPLKLHATLVNTIYAKKTASGKNRWGGGSGKIDAREVVGNWGETTWADNVRLERVAICEMGAKKIWEGKEGEGKVMDEIYEEVGWVELP